MEETEGRRWRAFERRGGIEDRRQEGEKGEYPRGRERVCVLMVEGQEMGGWRGEERKMKRGSRAGGGREQDRSGRSRR